MDALRFSIMTCASSSTFASSSSQYFFSAWVDSAYALGALRALCSSTLLFFKEIHSKGHISNLCKESLSSGLEGSHHSFNRGHLFPRSLEITRCFLSFSNGSLVQEYRFA